MQLFSPGSNIKLPINSPLTPTTVVVILGVLFVTFSVQAGERTARDRGKTVYKKANCVGCHKWHGGGGGGYGGLALSLRDTGLDAEAMAMVIRCGRPGTRMPYHDRTAFRGDNRNCYDATAAELKDTVPPRARYFLKDRDIAAVVEYVQSDIQGRGPPDHEDCVAFWGADARRCKAMIE